MTILETDSYTFSAADFGFYDPVDLDFNGYPTKFNKLLSVRITELPAAGTLKINNTSVLLGRSFLVKLPDFPVPGKIYELISMLSYTPAATTNGAPYQASFKFQVRDEGGTTYYTPNPGSPSQPFVPVAPFEPLTINRSLALASNTFKINVLPASPP